MSASFAQISRVSLIAGVAIVGTLAATVKVAADFEQSVTNAAVVTGKLGDELAITKVKLGDLVGELGRTTVFTAREAADALGILARKGFDVASFSAQEMRPFLDLAAATMTDLTFATDVLTETLKAFGLETGQVGRVADVFAKAAATTALDMNTLGEAMKFVAPIARTAGVSLEETTAALGRLAEQGIKGGIAGTALRRMFVELISPGKRLQETLERMGLTEEDVSLRTNTLTEVLAKLKGGGIEAGEVMDAFGLRAGPAALALLDVNNAGLESVNALGMLTKSFEDVNDAAKQMAEEQLKTLNGQLKLLKSALESVAIAIGSTLLPILTELATDLAINLRLVSEWSKENEVLSARIVKTAGALSIFLLATAAVTKAVSILLRGIGLVIGAFKALTSTAGLTAVGVVIAAGIIGFGLHSLWKNWRFIIDSITGGLKDLKLTVEVIFQGIATIISTRITRMKTMIVDFMRLISDAVQATKDFLAGVPQQQDFLGPGTQAAIEAGTVAPGGAPVAAQRPGAAGRGGDMSTTTNTRTVIVEPGAIQINASGKDESTMRRIVNDALLNLERNGEQNFGALSAMGAA